MSRSVSRVVNIICALAFLALLVFTLNHAYARYIYGKSGAGSVVANEFHFVSDYLAEDAPEYMLSPGTDTLTLTLGNHADALRISTDTILYSVSVTGADGVSVSPASGSLSGGTLSDVSVTLSGLKVGESYTVTAVGEAGFRQTLSASFTVQNAVSKAYKELSSDSASVTLTVWTDNCSGTASVSFPAGLIPDSTDPALAGVYNFNGSSYESGTLSDTASFTASHSSRTYRFFKSSPTTVYTAKQFTVYIDGTEAVVPSPA